MTDIGLKHLGIVVAVSKQTGALVGTTVAMGKKITGVGTKGMTAARNMVTRCVGRIGRTPCEETASLAEAPVLDLREEETTARKAAAKALVASLESDLAAARGKLKEVQSEAKKMQMQFASQLSDLEAEKEFLASDLKQARECTQEVTTRERAVTSQLAALESELSATRDNVEKARSKEKEATSQLSSATSVVETEVETEMVAVALAEEPTRPVTPEFEAPSLPDVTLDEVRAALFPEESTRVIFTRALSCIASQTPAIRADAARVFAGIHHELSVRVLAAQMVREPSVQVRHACIGALATLEIKEGLPTIEHALTDRAASVRLAALRGLYRLAGAKSAPALAGMLADKNEDVRRRAATCIGWLGQEEYTVKLLPLLTDSSVPVRRAAVEAMGNLGSRQVVSSLIEHLHDSEKSVRKAVLGALGTITGKKMSESLPPDEESHQRLIARWREWWNKEHLG